jgi:hypothetical protein
MSSSAKIKPAATDGIPETVRANSFGKVALIALGAGVAMLLFSGIVAFGDMPRKGARYAGKTSEGTRMAIKVNRQGNIQSLDTRVMTSCTQLGALQLDESDFGIGVRRKDGSFSDTYIDTEVGGFSFHGRSLLQVAKHDIQGEFKTSRRVTGTWRVRSVFYYEDLFPENSDPVANCDSGVVSWKARLRRG